MDQIKIGKFIAACRKKKNMTQAELAEKLNITDRAISKWETGKGMPDSSLMLKLCKELDISVNELLSGEMIKMEKYNETIEENLLELKRLNEESTKRLLLLEVIIGLISSISFLILIFTASFSNMENIARIILIALGFILFFIGVSSCILIEQKAGYYECGKCHHKYIPTYKQVLFAQHINRTRYMKCPKCKKKSWNKKVIK